MSKLAMAELLDIRSARCRENLQYAACPSRIVVLSLHAAGNRKRCFAFDDVCNGEDDADE